MMQSMIDSTHLLNSDDWINLRSTLQREGYLLLRNVIPRSMVLNAHHELLASLSLPHDGDGIYDESSSPASTSLLNRQDLTQHPAVKSILEHANLYRLTEGLFDATTTATFRYKWLRAVRHGDFTGIHQDRVYLGGSESYSIPPLTIWIPLCDINGARGSLAVVPRSHVDQRFEDVRRIYGDTAGKNLGPDGADSGWLSTEPNTVTSRASRCKTLGIQCEGGDSDNVIDAHWVTANFAMGDVEVHVGDLLHMTSPNTTERLRLSCDTRWLPVSIGCVWPRQFNLVLESTANEHEEHN